MRGNATETIFSTAAAATPIGKTAFSPTAVASAPAAPAPSASTSAPERTCKEKIDTATGAVHWKHLVTKERTSVRPDARLILPTASPKRSRMKKRAARDALRSFRRGNEDVEQQEMDRERASLFEDVAHVAVAAGGAAAPLSVLVALGGFDGRRRSGAAVTGVAKAVAKIHASVAKRRAVKAIRSKREARASESPMATTAARLAAGGGANDAGAAAAAVSAIRFARKDKASVSPLTTMEAPAASVAAQNGERGRCEDRIAALKLEVRELRSDSSAAAEHAVTIHA
jgi:hypothetical protein